MPLTEFLCPECLSGKHGPRYCAGWTLNEEDEPVGCDCTCTKTGDDS